MRNLSALILIVFFSLSTYNQNIYSQILIYDGDQDGCVGLTDLLGLLSEFGTCGDVPFVCGDVISHAGFDYATELIGNQCWFTNNCRYLPSVSPSSSYAETTPVYYVYDYEGSDISAAMTTANYEDYGVLYNWPAVMAGGICPSDWHIPSDEDWQALEVSIGMCAADAMTEGWRGTDEGYKMKANIGWAENPVANGNGSDSSGLHAIPGGYRYSGGFGNVVDYGYWWSTTVSSDISKSKSRSLGYDHYDVYRGDNEKQFGYSALCVVNYNIVSIYGCIDNSACNYDPSATQDDGSCQTLDACGICGGTGIPEGNCDCFGNQLNEVGECGGECVSDVDSDGICDEVDDCVGEIDECGICNGNGIPCDDFQSCGDEKFHDNHFYTTVTIGGRCWFAENCRFLPSVSMPAVGSETDPHFYVFDFIGTNVVEAKDTPNFEEFGVLYNWPAVMSEGVCPAGWFIPTDGEWQAMEMSLGMSAVEADSEGWRGEIAGLLKSETGWNDGLIGIDGSNESGFTGIPGGFRFSNGFSNGGTEGAWWSSTNDSENVTVSWSRRLSSFQEDWVGRSEISQALGRSARCIFDTEIVEVIGCTDNNACNFNPEANEDDGNCLTLDECDICGGDGLPCADFQSCGDVILHDDYYYSTVQIGEQCWFSENCRYLPEVSPSNEENTTDPYYYVYGYEGTDVASAQSTENYATYGVLYNWPAVMSEGICPTGWHIPSDSEWQTMEISIGMSVSEASTTNWRGTNEGFKLKSIQGWELEGSGSNSIGFTGLSGGLRISGDFVSIGHFGDWWSSSEFENYSWSRRLGGAFDTVRRDGFNRSDGFSARCIQD